jgi:tetratricopeptide (TPR) repeat protein
MQNIQKTLSVSYAAFTNGDTDLAIKSLVTSFAHRSNHNWTPAEKLSTYTFLAWLYFDQRRLTNALDCLWKVLYLQEQIFGINSPQTANTVFNLAEICRQLGLSEQAEDLYERLAPVAIHSLGIDHPCCELILKRRQEMEGLAAPSDNRASSSSVHQTQSCLTE